MFKTISREERVNFILWLYLITFAPISCLRMTPVKLEFCAPEMVTSKLKLLARNSYFSVHKAV